MFTNIDAQLQAGAPPDVFRVPYYTFGSYAGRDQLLDLSPHLADGFSDRFTPQAWAAVQSGEAPFGVPHHTDTTAILYDVKALADAGITDIPQSIDQALTWEEFYEAARLDGANGWQRLRHVTVPQLRPQSFFLLVLNVIYYRQIFWRIVLPLSRTLIAVLFFMSFLQTWNDFAWPSIALRQNELYTLPIGLLYLQGQFGADYGGTMAFALITVSPMVVVFLLAQRWFVQGFSRSGLR